MFVPHKKMKASFKKLAENANQLMKADKRSFHKLNKMIQFSMMWNGRAKFDIDLSIFIQILEPWIDW